MLKENKNIKEKMGEDTKDHKESSTENTFNLDGILSELGSFGKYQLLLLLLLAFRDSFLAMCNFNYVFTAAEVNYRCEIPECEGSNFTSWANFTFSNDTEKCFRMEHRSHIPVPYNSTDRNDTAAMLSLACAPENFHSERTVRCEKIVYEDYNSIVAEFDLGCEPWKATMIGTVHNMGLVFSFVLSGFVSDKYGRKVIIVGTPLVVGVIGLIKSFSVNYWMLLVFEFLETALGYGNGSLILSLETVSHKRRVVFSCLGDILSSFGTAFFGLIAWKVPYWRHMLRAIYAPLLVVVFYIFLVDEGVRWLLAHDKKDEAVRVLNKVAKINNITLSNKAKTMLNEISEERSKAEVLGQPQSTEKNQIMAVLRSKTIMLRMMLIAAIFVCCNFVFSGTIINSTTISGNKYINFSALLLVSIPTRVVTAFTLTRFGRKAPISTAYMLCAIFFITSAFVPQSVSWASLVLYLAGKMCSSYGMFSVTVVAMEIFPTTSRNLLTNIANTAGRLSSVLAPQTPLLKQYMFGLPSIVFGLVALGPACLALLLPDTSRVPLPDNVEQAEQLDTVEDTDSTEGSEEHSQPTSVVLTLNITTLK